MRPLPYWLLTLLPVTLLADTHRQATFVPPSGWTRQASATYVTYTRISGNSFCQLAVYDDQAGRATPEESFAAEWAGVFSGSFAPGPAPAVSRLTTPAGYSFASGESGITDRNGNRFYARLAAFLLPSRRVQSLVWISNSQSAMSACEPEWKAILESLRFPFSPAGSPAAPAAVSSDVTPASPGQFGNMRYTVPAGWTESRKGNLVTLTPTRLQGEEQLAIVLMPGRSAGGTSLDRELAAMWNEVIAGYGAQPMRNVSGQAYDAEAIRRTAAGWDYITANGGFMAGNRVYTLRPYLFQVRDRIERLFVLAIDFRADLVNTNAMSSPRFEPEIFQFVFSLRFGPNPDPAGAARPAVAEGSGIEGVWGGSAMSFGSIKTHMAIFFNDGSAYFGPRFPTNGLLDLDPAVERERAPRDWGTWNLSGGAGQLRMPYGAIPIRQEPGGTLVLTTSNTPHRYIRLPMPSLSQLAGNWCLADGVCLSLTADGRFRDAGGVLRILEHPTYPYPMSRPNGSGTFQLRRNTLVFRYDDGSEFRVAFPGLLSNQAEARPSQLWLSFNFDVLTRR